MMRLSFAAAFAAVIAIFLAPLAVAQTAPAAKAVAAKAPAAKAAAPQAAALKTAAQAPALANWAGFFIAADYKAHSGADSEVFDNGRRDVAKAFIEAGMKRENTLQFSVRPQRYADTPEKPLTIEGDSLPEQMSALTQKATGGCLFFLTSHGTPSDLVFGDRYLPPGALGRMLNESCGTRPTVVIISACFSGIFAPVLSGPNRVVLTAARYDRSSFGCGEDDVYTFFDTCLLEELPAAGGFDVLATRLKICVEKRERDLGMRPPSEPQSRIGLAFEAAMKTHALARSYKVKPGDTLAKISQEMYGEETKASAIYEANRPLFATRAAAPAPGTTLKIPPV